MRTSPRLRPKSRAPPAEVTAASADATPRPLTERTRRSLGSRVAPAAVLVLGCIFIAVALSRLDGVYASDPGVYRSRQLAPKPIAFAHSLLLPVAEAGRNAFAKSSFGGNVCTNVAVPDSICKSRPLPDTNDARREALECQARRLFGRGSSDVTVTGWEEQSKRLVAVTVAVYADERATARALRASRSRRVVNSVKKAVGTPIARSAWFEGERVLVGMLVTAPTRAAAREQLRDSRGDVRAYVATMRFLSYELLAIGPLLLLFALVFGGRALGVLAFGAAFAVFSLAAIAVLLVGLILYLPIVFVRRRWGRRPPRLRLPRSPFGTRPLMSSGAGVQSLDGEINSVAAENRSVMLVVAGLVRFAIALLTRSLFPASLAWGSLLLVALYSPTDFRRGSRWIVRGRKVVRVLVLVTAAGVLLGVSPL